MTNKHSILFVHNGKGLGGAPKTLRYAIEACLNVGYECSVACLKCPDTNSYFNETGAKVIVVDSLPHYTNSTSEVYKPGSKQFQQERKYSTNYASYWRKVLEQHGPFSLVFINSMRLCDLIVPSQEAGCRVIQVVRETAQPGPSLEIMKGIIGFANTVLFISEYDRDLFSLNSTRVVVIPDAVDATLYSCSEKEKFDLRLKYGVGIDDSVLLFTGGYINFKGGELLLKSLQSISISKPIILFYAGYGATTSRGGIFPLAKTFLSRFSKHARFYNERITRLLSCINRKKLFTIKLLGYSRNIEEFFMLSDICAVPYSVPHQAMPIFEAGMAKIPCLVTKFPCFKYEITDGDNGYLLPVNDPNAWARKIEELASDPDKQKMMGENNFRRAMARHDIHRNTEKLLSLISEIIDR